MESMLLSEQMVNFKTVNLSGQALKGIILFIIFFFIAYVKECIHFTIISKNTNSDNENHYYMKLIN